MKLRGCLITIIVILLIASCKEKRPVVEVKSWEPIELVKTLESGVKQYQGRVHFTKGPPMLVQIYEPLLSGKEKAPSVVIAPSGTPFITGSSLGEAYFPEHIPYAEKGIYVVAYELAGKVDDYDDLEQYKKGIELFNPL